MMAADLVLDLQNLKDSLRKNATKHKMVNEITNKFRQNQYSEEQINDFLKLDVILDSSSSFKRLYVNFLIETKNDEMIIQSLLAENDEIIDDIIKRCDFFWSNNSHTVDFFIDQIFPRVSYSQRNRIFHCLDRTFLDSQDRAKIFFDRFNVLYDVGKGRIFLKHCALDVWIDLINQKIYLTKYELMNVFKKRSRDILYYLEKIIESRKINKLSAKFINTKYEHVFFELFRLHPEETFKLIDKKENIFYSLKISRKSTKKFIRIFLDFVLSNINSMAYNRVVIFKYLTKEQLESSICELFPDENALCRTTFPYVNWRVSCYMSLFKRNEDKLDMIQKCYKRIYGKELLDDKRSKITFELLTWMDDKEMRHKFALEKFESGININIIGGINIRAIDWIPYMKTEESIPKLKELVQTSMKVDDRKQFVKNLIITCKINKDYKSLLAVLKFFNLKHKNEQLEVRIDFLMQLNNSFGTKLSTLDSEHWDEIYILLCNFDMKLELCQDRFDKLRIIFTEALNYSAKDKSLFENWFNMFFNWCNQCFRFCGTFFSINKRALILASEYLSKIEASQLLLYYFKYNRENPEDPIPLINNTWILNSFEEDIKNALTIDEMVSTIDYIEQDENVAKHFSESIIELKKSVLRKCSTIFDLNYVIKCMSCDPDYIRIIIIPKLCNHFIYNLKKLRFFKKHIILKKIKRVPGFETLLHQKCYDILRNDKTDQLKESALWILCPHLSASEFFQFVQPYYPKDKIAEMGTDENKYKFRFQKRIAYSLINFKSNAETMEALKAFCYGDYLQITVGSLNSICQKIPYYRSKDFLENSINVPVSFKKHILRLLCTISEKDKLITLLKKLWIDEKNPAIRKILLEKMLKYLINEIDNYVWWLAIEQCIQEVNERDKDIIETFTNLNEIPKKYKSRSGELIWKKLLELEKVAPQFKQTRLEMLQKIIINMNDLEDEIIEYFLKENLFDISVDKCDARHYFKTCVKYMLMRRGTEGDWKRRVAFVIENLQIAFDKYWNLYDANKKIFTIRSIISNFINHIFYEALQLDLEGKNFISIIIQDFVESLKKIFDPEIYFYSSYIYFEFILIFFKINKNLFEFGKEIRNIIDREIEKYENIIINQLASNVEKFLKWISINDHQTENLIEGILDEPLQSIGCALMAYFLINIKKLVATCKKRKLNDLLLNTNDKRIKLYLNDKFNCSY